jgi:enamine deaminase RidA (YjgF/YER057c/UK114 family)
VRTVFTEGSDFEAMAGYSRAVRIGAHVAVSATAARAGGDAYEQATEALQRALNAALELGARPEDVLRTRLLLAPGCDWERVIAAHREVFEGIAPANTTYYVGGFIPEGVLVEVELDAIVGEA